MEIRVQKHVYISMVEYLENEGCLEDLDWGNTIFVSDNITGEEFSIVD